MQPQKIPLIMAPLAGITDSVFRRIVKQFGADIVYTEMVSAKGLYYGDKKTRLLLRSTEEERPVTAQLFGSDPAIMAEAARRVCEYAPDGIDINMGCPMLKIVKGGDGCALMRDVPLASRVCAAVAAAAAVPVSVKFRKGWDEAHVNAVEFARAMQESGAASLTVHGRTYQQLFTGRSDPQIIAAVKAAVRIPVYASGDIDSPEAAQRIAAETGCDGLMVGRGALGDPWLFSRIRAGFEGRPGQEPTPAQRVRMALTHAKLLCEDKGERLGIRESRKHTGWYIKGLKSAARIRNEANHVETYAELDALLGSYLDTLQVKEDASYERY